MHSFATKVENFEDCGRITKDLLDRMGKYYLPIRSRRSLLHQVIRFGPSDSPRHSTRMAKTIRSSSRNALVYEKSSLPF